MSIVCVSRYAHKTGCIRFVPAIESQNLLQYYFSVDEKINESSFKILGNGKIKDTKKLVNLTLYNLLCVDKVSLNSIINIGLTMLEEQFLAAYCLLAIMV